MLDVSAKSDTTEFMVNKSKTETDPIEQSASARLLVDIEAFLVQSPMGESYFGRVSCGNTELLGRLRAGGECRHASIVKVRRFLADRKEDAKQQAVENSGDADAA